MITINLLPDELKPVERTSPKNLLTIVGSVLLVIIAIVIFSLNRSSLNRLKVELQNKQAERENLRKFEKENADLSKLVSGFKGYKDAVESIMQKKSNVSKKLYYFAQIFSQAKHPVWINNLSISAKEKAAAKKTRRGAAAAAPSGVTYEWQMSCFCASGEIETATRFHRAIQSDALFFEGFSVVMNIPEFVKQDIPGNYQQKVGYNFNLNIEMQAKPKVTEKKDAKKDTKRRGK